MDSVDLLALHSLTEDQWHEVVSALKTLRPSDLAHVWGRILERLASCPPPMVGELTQDQWLRLCVERSREMYRLAMRDAGVAGNEVDVCWSGGGQGGNAQSNSDQIVEALQRKISGGISVSADVGPLRAEVGEGMQRIEDSLAAIGGRVGEAIVNREHADELFELYGNRMDTRLGALGVQLSGIRNSFNKTSVTIQKTLHFSKKTDALLANVEHTADVLHEVSLRLESKLHMQLVLARIYNTLNAQASHGTRVIAELKTQVAEVNIQAGSLYRDVVKVVSEAMELNTHILENLEEKLNDSDDVVRLKAKLESMEAELENAAKLKAKLESMEAELDKARRDSSASIIEAARSQPAEQDEDGVARRELDSLWTNTTLPVEFQKKFYDGTREQYSKTYDDKNYVKAYHDTKLAKFTVKYTPVLIEVSLRQDFLAQLKAHCDGWHTKERYNKEYDVAMGYPGIKPTHHIVRAGTKIIEIFVEIQGKSFHVFTVPDDSWFVVEHNKILYINSTIARDLILDKAFNKRLNDAHLKIRMDQQPDDKFISVGRKKNILALDGQLLLRIFDRHNYIPASLLILGFSSLRVTGAYAWRFHERVTRLDESSNKSAEPSDKSAEPSDKSAEPSDKSAEPLNKSVNRTLINSAYIIRHGIYYWSGLEQGYYQLSATSYETIKEIIKDVGTSTYFKTEFDPEALYSSQPPTPLPDMDELSLGEHEGLVSIRYPDPDGHPGGQPLDRHAEHAQWIDFGDGVQFPCAQLPVGVGEVGGDYV